jgi:hypothetical protein
LGLPLNCPVYFAVDRDLQDPTTALPYFEGIASVRPPATNGDYGEGALCQLLHDRGLTAYHWQSESTAFPGNTTTLPITNIQQVFDQQPLPGTDLDILCKPDFGQWPRLITNQPGDDMIASTPSGNGYWICKPDGSIWSFGDAQWLGAMNWPTNVLVPGDTITGFTSHPTTPGYWISTDKGSVYAYGAATWHGNLP